jgi:hypothetical protein
MKNNAFDFRSFLLLGFLAALGCAHHQVPSSGENRTGLQEHGMANCPSTVQGAQTIARDVEGGVEVTIVSIAPGAEAEIRSRAHTQAEITGATGSIRHTGQGTGGGVIGYCPVIHPGVYHYVDNIPGGVRVKLIAHKPGDVSTLRRATRERISALESR